MRGNERQSNAVKTLSIIAAFLFATTAFAGVRDNDDTCDIKIGPAATLLLPYFEVDIYGNSGQTTLFTVTNVTRYPQIAHVTLWTDRAYPVLTFNLYLTGYDVQTINLADVLLRNVVAPPAGTSSSTKAGLLSSAGNPNVQSSTDCDANPGLIPASLMAAVRSALTTGVMGTCATAGNVHLNAIGYATIDVVASCSSRLPNDPLYFSNDIVFDNVLIGDYQNLGPQPAGELPSGSFDATANPMVHIRAVPEGGSAGAYVFTGLPYTFYDRYTPATSRTRDRRQPLPSTFAARFIQGGPASFRTNLNIWREVIIPTNSCSGYEANRYVLVPEIVRFDEHENAMLWGVSVNCAAGCGPFQIQLPAASSTSSLDNDLYPGLVTADIAGWFYLNLNNGGSTSYSVTRDVGGLPAPTNSRGNLAPPGSTTTHGPRPSQNWVTVTMFGNAGSNRLAAEFDAASLGNGCSPAAFLTTADGGNLPIGPAGGVFVCPPGPTLTNGTTTQCVGTNVNPTP
ncbi:MAG: hypothetical protein QOC81_5066 [Thermoanaerobaculia bacterium]|jgi:hypothetical protein|nr:hypothetical protein [Thermoanaerobaculia bacterium]